jgi:predicted small lipoprotein YifL
MRKLIFSLFLMLVLVSFTDCGKKAPPTLPPEKPPQDSGPEKT